MRLPDPAVNASAGAPTGTAPCTRPPPRLQWIRHVEVRCGASLGPNPCFGVGPMDAAGPHETIAAEFFPRRCATPRDFARGIPAHRLLAPASLQKTRPLRSSAALRPTRFGGPAASMNGPPSQGIGPGDDTRRTTRCPLSVTSLGRKTARSRGSSGRSRSAPTSRSCRTARRTPRASRLPHRHKQRRGGRGVAAHQSRHRRFLRLAEPGRTRIRSAQALRQSRPRRRAG